MLDTIHIVYTSDPQTFEGLLASMITVTRNLHDAKSVDIHVIVDAEDLLEARQVVNAFYYVIRDIAVVPNVLLHRMRHASFDFEKLKAGNPSISENFHRWPTKQHLYNMYYVHEYLPQTASRALWIDTDTIVFDDVSLLFWMRMRHAVAAPLYGGIGEAP